MSIGVNEFIELVKTTKGLLNHLKFKSIEELEEYIHDNNLKDFQELRNEADEFIENKKR